MARHGSTAYNDRQGHERYRSWLDIPLDAQGFHQAEELAAILAGNLKSGIVLLSSPMQRAMVTAQAVSRTLGGVPVQPRWELMDWNVGECMGKIRTESRDRALAKLQTVNPQKAPKGGEPYNAFLGRILPFVATLLQAPGEIVCVTHSRVLRAVDAWVQAGCRPDMVLDQKVMAQKHHGILPGGLMALAFDPTGHVRVFPTTLGHEGRTTS